MKKKLFRSREQKMLAGVCGGFAEYLGLDVVWIRLIYVILSLIIGSGVLIYILAAVIIPLRPENMKPEYRYVKADYEIREEDD